MSATVQQQQQQNTTWKSCFRSDLFNGKIALVTGGGTGIGKSITKELALLGATVIIASRDVTKCQTAANEINATLPKGGKGKVVVGLSTNIRNEESITKLVEHILETYEKIDFLVNNAGGQFIVDSADLSRKGFNAVLDTNLIGTFLLCREVYNQWMRDNGGGSIVNITICNRNGMPGMMHSAASRAGVENMTATLCQEWMDSNVRINCVRPGIIFTDSGFENYGPAGDYFLERILNTVPSKRLGSPEEVSSAVSWLLSEGASYVTGCTINIDGGSSYFPIPLIDIEEKEHLPVYGTLPPRARL